MGEDSYRIKTDLLDLGGDDKDEKQVNRLEQFTQNRSHCSLLYGAIHTYIHTHTHRMHIYINHPTAILSILQYTLHR